jgi:hypothetical protein
MLGSLKTNYESALRGASTPEATEGDDPAS